MISKEQFLELKHLKSLGVPTTRIAKKLGISIPSANKWLRIDEETFDELNQTTLIIMIIQRLSEEKFFVFFRFMTLL